MSVGDLVDGLDAGAESDPARLRKVLGAFPTGVTAVAALVDGEPVGLAANSFTSVSLDPPLVAVCVARSSTTWPVLRSARRFGVSVLSADQEAACRQLAARDGNRFAGLPWRTTADGAVLIESAGAWLECSTDAVHGAGDHDIVVMRVHQVAVDPRVRPLVFHGSRFRRLEETTL